MAALAFDVLTLIFLSLFARDSSETLSPSSYYDSSYYPTQHHQWRTLLFPSVSESSNLYDNHIRRVSMNSNAGDSTSANGRTFGSFANLFGLQTMQPVCPMCPACPGCPMCPTTTCTAAPETSTCKDPLFASPLSITPCTAATTLVPVTARSCIKVTTASSGTFTVTLAANQFVIFGVAAICPNTKVTVTCLLAGTAPISPPTASTLTQTIMSGTPVLETGSTQIILACVGTGCTGGTATCSWNATK